MKTIRIINSTLAIAAALALSPAAFAQTTVTTASGGATTSVSTTTTAGTISDFGDDTIVVRSETSPDPIRYSYSKTTTYVDEAGAPVSRELVKSGLPVTVYYVKEGDRMIANKVVVRKKTTTTTGDGGTVVEKKTTRSSDAPAVIEKKSSTTTTIEK
ncbi:MAG: hypothetical protein JWL59_950 [Chthoniobacteraceae bacterium]|nr:hypothetical protein [Chthoniobacteraceae bacterium]